MSTVHKVINLKKPLKIFDFTIVQLVIMTFAVVLAIVVAGKVPGEWKIANAPCGFWLGLFIVCAAIVGVKATEVKPAPWWRNAVFYRLKLTPDVYYPHPEASTPYPDETIIDPPKKDDQAEFYIAEHPMRNTQGNISIKSPIPKEAPPTEQP